MNISAAYDDALCFFQTHCETYESYLSCDLVELTHKLSQRNVTPSLKILLDEASRKYQRSLRFDRRKTLLGYTKRKLALELIESSYARFGGSAPKTHHWIPLCYSKNFTRHVQQSRARNARIPAAYFTGDSLATTVVLDSAFAHEAKNKVGFYQLSAEYLFGLIESSYSNAMTRLREGHELRLGDYSSLLRMMIVQHVRAQQLDGQFLPVRTVTEFAELFQRLLEGFDFDGHAYVETAGAPYYFSPHTPTRMRRFGDGARAWYFPLSSDHAFIFSERELTQEERLRMAKGSPLSTVKWARRAGRSLYGVSEQDFDGDC